MVAASTVPSLDPVLIPERRVLLTGLSWAAYLAIDQALGDRPGTRLTYLDGELEIMTTSESHEILKKLIARMLETWADELDVDLDGCGNATFRKKAAKVGLEPDECYFVGRRPGGRPDIAIEVVISNPLVHKLDVYRGLGVREVWVLHAKERVMKVHSLVGARYRERASSALLPGLDLAHLVSFVQLDRSQTALAKAYRTALRRRA